MLNSKIIFLPLVSLLCMACDRDQPNPKDPLPNKNESDTTITSAKAISTVDASLMQKSRETLNSDYSLSPDARSVQVSSLNGIITLKGTLNSEAEKQAVINKVKQIKGVVDVKDNIEVSSRPN